MAVGVRQGASVELNALWVAPEARGHGAAAALIEAVEGWATEIGASRLELEVTRSSEAARRLYERLGFATVSADRTCGERHAPALRMHRVL
jgi:GNAT superfamily N-acetyltransferase